MNGEYFEAVDVLRKIGVNFVGIDFDVRDRPAFSTGLPYNNESVAPIQYLQQTFISRHTGGRWEGSAEELALSARTEFRNLVPILLESGENVSIHNKSPQSLS